MPMTTPAVVSSRFSVWKYCMMWPRVAPTARRMPICRRRWPTQKLVRPTMPNAVTASITTHTSTSIQAMLLMFAKYFLRMST